jgi:hypothetical protein
MQPFLAVFNAANCFLKLQLIKLHIIRNDVLTILLILILFALLHFYISSNTFVSQALVSQEINQTPAGFNPKPKTSSTSDESPQDDAANSNT